MSWFKKNRTTILLVLAMIVGTALIAYPTFANWWNNIHQSRAVAAYVQSVEKMNTEDYDQVIREAEEYNRRLTETGVLWTMTDDERAEYQRQLKIESTDIMGYIDIEKAKIHLPVYHGTEDSILQVAIGHIEGTSLPVGGKGTHCVVSGHRGLPSAKLFTDIDKLVEGDVFTLTVLDHVAAYEVDQILTVQPTDVSALRIDPEQDYCSLVTCTPYGVNTHRLIVRGRRIPNIEKTETKASEPGTEGLELYVWIPGWILETPIFILAPAGTAALIVIIFLIRWIQRLFRKK